MKSHRYVLFSAAAVVALAAITLYYRPVQAHTRITTDVTWSEHIQPIFKQKCMGCHHPGGIAPDYVNLTFYGTDTDPGARAWAVSIEEQLMTGKMPPWDADHRFTEFSNSKGLTEEEEDYIIAWIQGGAPQGPIRDIDEGVQEEVMERAWEFGEPDRVFQPQEPAGLAADEMKRVAEFTFPIDVEEDGWITGVEFLPENPKNIQRMSAWLLDAGGVKPEPIEMGMQVEYDPLADDEGPEPTRMRPMPKGPHFLGQWVRGDEAVLFPTAGARPLRVDSSLLLRIEYERPQYADWSQPIEDHSQVGLFLAAPDEEIDYLVETQTLTPEAPVTVAANDAAFVHEMTYTFDESAFLFGLHPLLGVLGKRFEATVTYPDGLDKTLIVIPNYRHKVASSYFFERPVYAPKGTTIHLAATYDNSEDNWDNPNMPPEDVAASGEPGAARFAVMLDYYLEDHLVITQPLDVELYEEIESKSQGGMTFLSGLVPSEEVEDGDTTATQVAAADVPLAADAAPPIPTDEEMEGIWWCPMRGDFCRVMDYHEFGQCEDCGMDLKPKKTFFENKEVAPTSSPWNLTLAGTEEIYWCPNRGRDDHTLVDYSKPGTCPTCYSPLIHQTRFETVHSYTCMTPECGRYQSLFFGPGLCPECGQPVAGMGHMDHTPVHGGWQFFMADNLYHHLEGTMHEPGTFKLYFYDDWKNPLDARNFRGTVYVPETDAETGAVTETEYDLYVAKEGNTWLNADLPTDLPIDFYAMVWLAGEEKRYDFEFEELTVEPQGTDEKKPLRLHTHEREPVTIPPTVAGIMREIVKRDKALASLIAAEDWYGLHYPAYDAKDYVAALAERQDGLNVRQRGQLKNAIGVINRAANLLDRAGDAADAPRANRAYEDFDKGVQMLLEVFPQPGTQ